MGNTEIELKPEEQFTLASLRKRLNLTLDDVSDYIGISKYRLMSIEKDSSDLGIVLSRKFSKLYSVPLENIFFGDEITLSKLLREKGGYTATK